MNRENGAIVCLVEDNGIGIQKALELKHKNGDHKSVGLKVTKERLSTLNSFKKNGRGIEIIDLAEKGGSSGTRVKIIIPVEDVE